MRRVIWRIVATTISGGRRVLVDDPITEFSFKSLSDAEKVVASLHAEARDLSIHYEPAAA